MKVSRRDFLKLGAAGVGAGAAANFFPNVLRAAGRKPNVLFIAVDDLRPFLIEGPGTRVSVNELLELASAADAQQMFAQLPKAVWLMGRSDRSIESGAEPQQTIEALQERFGRRLYALANRLYYNCVFNLGAVLAFCYLKRSELANLIVLTESLRYDIPRMEVAQRMLGSESM